jgi:hypothetical protein
MCVFSVYMYSRWLISNEGCSPVTGVAAVAGVAVLQLDERRPQRADSLGAANALTQSKRPRVNSLSLIMIVL